MSMPRILICGDLKFAHKELRELFNNLAEVVTLSSSIRSRADFLIEFEAGGKFAGTVGIYRRNISKERIGIFDKELIKALTTAGVRWIAQNGAGYDEIDVAECKLRGIGLSNTPRVVDDATATAALYLIISCLRHFSLAERSLQLSQWKTLVSPGMAHDVTNRTLCILGLGGIGLRLAHLAHAFPMRIFYHSRTPPATPSPDCASALTSTSMSLGSAIPPWCTYVPSVKELCELADVLSIHVPLVPETIGLVGKAEISAMKKGSVLINTARGKVVDENAMIDALETGHLSSVGLDVFPSEPSVNPRLLAFPQAVLLPHIGGETYETEYERELCALRNLRDFLRDGRGTNLVPELRE
ncbi:hypothetical protein BJ138DRAFT_1161724 [Hygrophoropsis aurantiaca]|uniref:Uncharacterized protein n=1 Tax=Hygrophoropsis aurantiaca TaxID=72124 RepID=A0ACB8A101_9AGAM|nr:hypothetical protein BJ138DRAFT_1161724 [Hygrophoropsis aurantiaca]